MLPFLTVDLTCKDIYTTNDRDNERCVNISQKKK